MANHRHTAEIYNFHHDMYGNPTAHFTVWDHKTGKIVARTNKQRQQTGYDGSMAEGALYALQRATGKKFRIARTKGNRSTNYVTAYFTAA